jgi:hypothetical protein
LQYNIADYTWLLQEVRMPQNLSLSEYERDIEKRLTTAELRPGSLVRLRALLQDEISAAAEFLAEIRAVLPGNPCKVRVRFPEKDLDNGVMGLNASSFVLGIHPDTKEVVACGYFFIWADLDGDLSELTKQQLLIPT